MPIKTDLNVAPYFDDFDENKDFHRIVFRPKVPVQARELTQLQSILQDQIEKFGNWAFKNGDIVTGCSIIDIPVMPYVRLEDFQTNTSNFDINNLLNSRVVSTANLQARVIAIKSGTVLNYPNTDPTIDTNRIYLKYLNTGENGEAIYSNTDQLTFITIPETGNTIADTIAVINVYSNATTNTFASGNAHGISVSDGVVFLNGNFVRVNDSTVGIVNAYGTNAGNNVVGFDAVETIITEDDDESLLDNALGYSNENAPGAHRLKITPTLVSLDPTTAANTDGFNPIVTYNYGSMVTKATAGISVFTAINDAIAKRTYEESGNYVVNPFIVDSITNASVANSQYGANGMFARINSGSGYASGYRVEVLNTTYVDMRRGVDTKTNKEQQISFNYGGYYVLNEVAGSFDFEQAQTVNLYDLPQQAVTRRSFSSILPSGNLVGTASVRCFSYISGDVGAKNAKYALHLFNIKLNSKYTINDIKSIHYTGGIGAVGDVFDKSSTSSILLYNFGKVGIKNLRDENLVNNTSYNYRNKQSSTMDTSGNVVITISPSTGGIDYLPFGTGQLSDLTAATINLIMKANTQSAALSGTVAINSTNNHVTGTSTVFTSDFIVGDQILVGSDIRTVTNIVSNVGMDVDVPFSSTLSGQTYYKRYPGGKIIPINSTINGSYVNVTNTTSFTIASKQKPSSVTAVDVIFDVKKTQAVPAKKELKKNRFVKIDTTGNPNGPWCLGFSDVVSLKGVYSSMNATGDITSNFVFDSGQKDSYYDYAYLYPQPGFNAGQTPTLLVQLDYLAVNSSPGVGFFTIESYPIDDANTANTIAIQTKDIPLYVSESGNKIPLRDYVDFRTPSIPSANDTGDVDTSNTTQLTAAISYATLSPSNTVSFLSPTLGLNVPSFGQNFQADYTYCLPRKDLIYITPENIIKVKEGVSSDSPSTPFCPENSMSLAVIDVPPYPTLTTDQMDSLYLVNRTSKSLVRDSSLSVYSTVNTNRRYTMKDIGNFDQRIKNLEYYVQLSLLEKKATDMVITDANGLDRFKNGIFVEPFGDYSLSDVSNPEYSVALDREKAVARPKIVREVVRVSFRSSGSTTTKTGRAITLPYTEVPNLVQPYATKYRNAALVAFAWNGTLMLIPSYDNNKDVVNTGSVNITIDTATPWQQFADSPFGTVWGDWRTSTTTDQKSQAVSIYVAGGDDVNFQQNTAAEARYREQIWTYLGRAGYSQSDFTLGSVSVVYVNPLATDGTPTAIGESYWYVPNYGEGKFVEV